MTTIPLALREQIRVQARNRCGYCLTRQEYVPWVLEIEHILPQARGGSDAEDNLWLACHPCNLYKSDQTQARDPVTNRWVRLYNPRYQKWQRHFQWGKNGEQIIGKTACGRATVIALNLNNLVVITVRRNWIAAGWHPPTD